MMIALAILAGALAACGSEKASTEADMTETPASSQRAVEVSGGNPAAEQASQQIEGDYMRGIVAEISDDRYEGRGPGSQGDAAAREYLVERMVEIGLEPGAADGGWEQPFDLVGVNASQPDSWTFAGHGDSMSLKQWDQVIVGCGVQQESVAIEDAEIVFVG